MHARRFARNKYIPLGYAAFRSRSFSIHTQSGHTASLATKSPVIPRTNQRTMPPSLTRPFFVTAVLFRGIKSKLDGERQARRNQVSPLPGCNHTDADYMIKNGLYVPRAADHTC